MRLPARSIAASPPPAAWRPGGAWPKSAWPAWAASISCRRRRSLAADWRLPLRPIIPWPRAWRRSMPVGRSRRENTSRWARDRCGPPPARKRCSTRSAIANSPTWRSAFLEARAVSARRSLPRAGRAVRRRAGQAHAAGGADGQPGRHGASRRAQRRDGAAQVVRAGFRSGARRKRLGRRAVAAGRRQTIWRRSVARTTRSCTAAR